MTDRKSGRNADGTFGPGNPGKPRGTRHKATRAALDVGPAEAAAKAPWPKTMPEQIAAVRAALDELGEASPEQVARQFKRAQTRAVEPLLESLAALGQARPIDGGRFTA